MDLQHVRSGPNIQCREFEARSNGLGRDGFESTRAQEAFRDRGRLSNKQGVEQDPASQPILADHSFQPITGTSAQSMSLSRIAETLDEVLVVHTRIRNELEMLRVSRSRLETSLDRLDGCLAVWDSSDSHGMQNVISPRASRPTENHITAAYPLEVGANGSTSASTQQPAIQLWKPQSADNAGVLVPSIETALAHIRQDLERLREQERAFGATLQLLSSKEDRMNETQRSLASALKNPVRASKIVAELIANDEEASTSLAGSPRPASDIPSIVQQYFDRCGDIGVWLERLDELREAWAEGAAEREFMADRGDELEVTDEEYNETYEEREAYIERELADAREQADHLRSLCLAGSLDIDQYRTRRRSLTSVYSSEVLEPPQHPGLDISVDSAIPALSLEVHSAHLSEERMERISSWLRANEAISKPLESIAEDSIALSWDPSISSQAVPDPHQIPLPASPYAFQRPTIIASDDSSTQDATRESVGKYDGLPPLLATASLLGAAYDHSLSDIKDQSTIPSSATTTGGIVPTQSSSSSPDLNDGEDAPLQSDQR